MDARPLLVKLIKLTLNHRVYATRTASNIGEVAAIFTEWQPRLMILDMELAAGAEIMALLRELHAEGLTVVLVTHEPDIAAYARRVILLRDGLVVEDHRQEPVTAVAPPSAPDPAAPTQASAP